MQKIIIENVPPYTGEHEIDLGHLTNRELHTIKVISGVRPGEIEEAGMAGDNDLVVALAVIALRRKGLIVNEDAIWDAEAGKITFLDEEADAVPPLQPSGADETAPAASATSSGASGNGTGASHPESIPSFIGTPA